MDSSPAMQTPPPRDGLLALPGEILEAILLGLGPRDLATVTRTCKRIAEFVNASTAIQYNAVLAERGYVDCPVRYEALEAARKRASGEATPVGPVTAPSSSSAANAGASTSANACPTSSAPSVSETRARPGGRSCVADAPAPPSTKSPFTGQLRPTLPSVTLASWPATPPRTRADYSALTAVQKNQALRDRERRWDSVTPAQLRTFRVSGQSSVYELQEGIMLMCEEMSPSERPRVIRLIPLPTANDPDLEDPVVPTKSFSVPFSIADLTMDPTQDLIIVSEFKDEAHDLIYRYHLLTMSTFEPHPLASVPILTFPTLDWIGSSRQLIQVMGDTVVIHVSCENASGTWEDEIVAWNWKTGNVMGRIAIGRTAMACSFCMLTPTTIAVARPNLVRVRGDDDDIESIDGPAILLISFTQRPKESDGGQPPNADDPTTPHAVEVTKLMMPPLIDDVLVVNFHMRPDPAYPVRSASDPTLGRGKPFTQDSTKGVVVSDFWLSHAVPFRSRFYELFMLRETLVEMATDGEARLQKSWDGGEMFDTLSVPWSNWGEHNTRLMDHVQPNRRRWVCSCSGYRVASLLNFDSSFGGQPWSLPEVEDPDNPVIAPPHRVHLLIHDFNPYTLARDRAERKRRNLRDPISSWVVRAQPDPSDEEITSASGAVPLAPEYTVTLWDAPSFTRREEFWEDDVITRLPFRTLRRGMAGRANGVMIDDQHILAIQTTDSRIMTKHDVTALCM